MKNQCNRRDFLQLTSAGALCSLGAPVLNLWSKTRQGMISPGCRTSKVRVARLYMGNPEGLWPKPALNFKEEMKFYQDRFQELKAELGDVDFVVDELVTSPSQVIALKDRLKTVDGILVIHLSLNVSPILEEILATGQPTMIFAVPFSGHEWANFGSLRNQAKGAKMECLLTSDYRQLAVAIRPFRAIHHLREAKILNVTTTAFADYAGKIKEKFGTEIKVIDRQRVLKLYEAISDADARRETEIWIDGAEKIVEPSKENIFKSCKLALALERLLDEEEATVLTIDCYGSMWDKTILLPAYPCLGFTRLNNMGYGGICESDLRSAMTHIIFQGLSGRPGFISDPTVDESTNTIILAHCLGTTKMDGPDGPAAPYKLRTVMERQEGVVPQVQMRLNQKVTQAILVGVDQLLYFTGEIVDAPVSLEVDRGCRTKIAVKVDGDVTTLWHNWSHGLHRQTCYGDITKELGYLCRFKEIDMVNEAV